MKLNATLVLFAALFLSLWTDRSPAQQVQIGTPFNTVTDEYYERIGVGFGFTLPASPNFRRNGGRGIVGLLPNGQIDPRGITFSQGSVNSAVPPFGGFDPGAQGQFGFAVRKGGGGFNLNLFGGKGSSRTLTSQTPSIVVPNGVPGTIADQTLRPFVTGITPVVGSFSLGGEPSVPISPVDLALQRLAERGQSLESLRDQIIDEQRQTRVAARQDPAPPLPPGLAARRAGVDRGKVDPHGGRPRAGREGGGGGSEPGRARAAAGGPARGAGPSFLARRGGAGGRLGS